MWFEPGVRLDQHTLQMERPEACAVSEGVPCVGDRTLENPFAGIADIARPGGSPSSSLTPFHTATNLVVHNTGAC